MDNVVWKDIPGYEGLYRVSNVGEIKSLRGWNGRGYVHREKILSKTMTTTGYYKVELTKDGMKQTINTILISMSLSRNLRRAKLTKNFRENTTVLQT